MANGKAPGDPFDTRLVRKLADILRDTELSEIEVEQGDLKIRVARELTAAAPAQFALPAAALAPIAQPAALAVPTTAAPEPRRAGHEVKSPMVGTVYLQAQPGADPFVKPGDRVRQGQTLLIVAAMKTMNPIPAPRDGVVLEILVGDAQPVEFDEPLVVIE
jgi:acetyl-CoA carboxylase biotin carboxyl carrier protein